MKIVLTLCLCFVLVQAYSQEQNEFPSDSVIKATWPTFMNQPTPAYSKRPMYLVDRKEISADELAKIKPDDIESIKVMKGPSATEAFGERAANGVVLIKMKKSKFDPQKKVE